MWALRQRCVACSTPQGRRRRVQARRASAAVGRTRAELRVAVDVDEVLGRFLHSLCQYCEEEHGLSHAVEDFFVYEFAKIWKCDQDTSTHLVHSFFESRYFQDGIDVMPGAFSALKRLKPEHDFVVVTSRQFVIQDETQRWIEAHFPDIFSDVHFGNHWAKEGASRKKSQICREIGADVLIDDNPAYAYECASAGIHALLYDWQHSYPWSKQPDHFKHEKIVVVRDWLEIEDALADINNKHAVLCAGEGKGASGAV